MSTASRRQDPIVARSTFAYLKELSVNNNRDWFQANKERYEGARANVLEFLEALCHQIALIDTELAELKAEKVLMRIYRDVRFSRDKTPYKSHFAAGLSPNGKMAAEPGYFISIAPDDSANAGYGGCFFAAGYWMPGAGELGKIRQEIDYNFKDLADILEKPSFKSVFSGLSEEGKLKKAPKMYAPEHPHIEWLKHKSFVVSVPLSEPILSSPNALQNVLNLTREAQPFVSYLRLACRV